MDQPFRFLTALPVYNEAAHIPAVLAEVGRHADDVLVVDDGSTDQTGELLRRRDDVHVISHPRNLGYGAALKTAFDYGILRCYDAVVTIDCDGQHEPQRIRQLAAACQEADIVSGSRYLVSGSRYLDSSAQEGQPPPERRRINAYMTRKLNDRLGLAITDAFCGFKAYRTWSLAKLSITEPGYAMPLELWVQAAQLGLRIVEIPVPLIYLDENRSFGGALDDGHARLAHYERVLKRALQNFCAARKSSQHSCGDVHERVRKLLMPGATDDRHWRAPTVSGDVLIDPAWQRLPSIIDRNRRSLAAWDREISGRSLQDLAGAARRSLLNRAWAYTADYRPTSLERGSTRDLPRLILAGHQPQLFHPGVWHKNFALARLAAATGATAVNLIIDSDLCRTTAIRVPAGTVDQPHAETMLYDRPAAEVPYEERVVLDEAQFATFAERVAENLRPFVAAPAVLEYWPMVRSRHQQRANLGLCLAQARHQLEHQWQTQSAKWSGSTLEIPQSAVCDLAESRWLFAHILQHLSRFRTAHNRALGNYRRTHRLRSPAHPAPDLGEQGIWTEAPFWIWSAEDPVRRPLFARADGERVVCSNLHDVEFELALLPGRSADSAVARLEKIAAAGIRIRTRALTTTLVARLLLGDLFLHGIGGAEYDRVTDEIIRDFFAVPPPEIAVVSATLRLAIDRACCRPGDRQQVDRQLRELQFHPERYLPDRALWPARQVSNLDAALDSKRRWIATAKTPANARRRHAAIVQANEQLQVALGGRRAELLQRRERLADCLRADQILNSREYAFCLFPQQQLSDLLLDSWTTPP